MKRNPLTKISVLISVLVAGALVSLNQAQDNSPEESAAGTLAEKITEDSGGEPSRFLEYTRRLVATLKQFTPAQRTEAIGYDPIPEVGGGGEEPAAGAAEEAAGGSAPLEGYGGDPNGGWGGTGPVTLTADAWEAYSANGGDEIDVYARAVGTESFVKNSYRDREELHNEN